MVRGLRVLGVGCLVLALAAGQALAQGKQGGKGRFGMGPGGGMGGGQQFAMMLLRADKVQKELDLVQEQKDKLKELADKSGFELVNVGVDKMDAFMKERVKVYTEVGKRMGLGK